MRSMYLREAFQFLFCQCAVFHTIAAIALSFLSLPFCAAALGFGGAGGYPEVDGASRDFLLRISSRMFQGSLKSVVQ